MSRLKKGAIVAVSTLALALPAATFVTAPAAAQGWHGGGWGGPAAAGLIGGLAVGALAASAYPYGYGGYGGCYVQNQPAYDGYGFFLGYRPVRVCY